MNIEMDLKEIAEDVFACLQPDKGLGTSNAGLVNSGSSLAVDTFWDLPHTRKMIEIYSAVRTEPVKYLVNTHENGDHMWGNQLFQGAEIIASQACADAFGVSERPEMLQNVRKESKVHFDSGLSSLDACKKIDLGPYADWTEPERLFFNAERSYREFRGEKWDTPVDTMANFKGVGRLRAFYAANC